MTADMTQLPNPQEDARAIVMSTLNDIFTLPEDQAFIASLLDFVDNQVMNNYSADAINLNLKQTDVYKQRFAGNEALKKLGIAPLSTGEYLEMERQYQKLLTNAGLGNLATRGTFASLIGGNVSPVEMETRITTVFDRINNADNALFDELQRSLGTNALSKTDLATSLLMGKEGTSWLQRKITTSEIGAEASIRGIKSTIGVEELANRGVTRQQASQGFETIKQIQPSLQNLGDIYGQSTSGLQNELEQEQFGGMLSQRRKRLTQQEKNTFSGSAGISTGSLAKSVSGNI